MYVNIKCALLPYTYIHTYVHTYAYIYFAYCQLSKVFIVVLPAIQCAGWVLPTTKHPLPPRHSLFGNFASENYMAQTMNLQGKDIGEWEWELEWVGNELRLTLAGCQIEKRCAKRERESEKNMSKIK